MWRHEYNRIYYILDYNPYLSPPIIYLEAISKAHRSYFFVQIVVIEVSELLRSLFSFAPFFINRFQAPALKLHDSQHDNIPHPAVLNI